jgi:hypothetical protein
MHFSFLFFLISKFYFISFSFIVVLGGGTLWHLQRFLQYINCIILEFIPPPLFFIPPPPDSWNSYNRYHYCIFMYVHTFFALYSPSYPLSPPTISPLPLVPTFPPGQDLFHPPVLWFCRREKINRLWEGNETWRSKTEHYGLDMASLFLP